MLAPLQTQSKKDNTKDSHSLTHNSSVNRIFSNLFNDNKSNSSPKLPRQPKLKINQPNDPYEIEADRVADQILRMSVSDYVEYDISNSDESIHRKCSICEMMKEKDEDDKKQINRKSHSNNNLYVSDQIANQINNIGTGRPLDSSTKSFMESRLNHDFSDVRIHNDSSSQELSRSVNAKAFTIGNNIFLGANEYVSDKRLMVHELVHVLQNKENNNSMVQREILTNNTEFTRSDSMQEITYSGDTLLIRIALQSLLDTNKVGENDDGTQTYFFNINANRLELESAFSSPQFSTVNRRLVSAMLDNHHVYRYYNNIVTDIDRPVPNRQGLQQMRSRTVDTHEITQLNLRRLTAYERLQAWPIFLNSIDYNAVLLAEVEGMATEFPRRTARTLPDIIMFPTGSIGRDDRFMPWLIHELMHFWQYRHGYSIVVLAIHAIRADYDYGGEVRLNRVRNMGGDIHYFGTEEQADIVKHYYNNLNSGRNVTAWIPYITDVQTGVNKH